VEDLIIANGIVATLGETNRLIPRGGVVIQNGVITEIAETSKFAGRFPGARFLDAHGGLIMPGFINAHHHFYGAFARGMPFEGPAPSNFGEILENVWWRLDKALSMDDVRSSTLQGMADCIRSGTTTVVDHHASPNAVKGSLDTVAHVCLETGLRACLCYEVSDRDGKRVTQQGLEENERFIKRCRKDWADGHQLSGAFGLHASFTVDDETLGHVSNAVSSLDVPIHIHLAEGTLDGQRSVEKYGARPLARLDRSGLLDRPALLAHCVDLTPEERQVLAAKKAWVLHNPQSNMNNAVGTLPICEMLADGVQVAVGTDGMTASMLGELRVLGLVHKAASLDPRTLGLAQLYQLLVLNNARLASDLMGVRVGVLETGAAGDVIILRYDPPTPLTEQNFMGHLYFGMTGACVDTTIVGGRVLMRGGEFQTIDEAAVMARSRELAPHVWKRLE
jgi:putative selenium metabolism protein SsnA